MTHSTRRMTYPPLSVLAYLSVHMYAQIRKNGRSGALAAYFFAVFFLGVFLGVFFWP